MATIERRRNANDEVVSCRIVVCCGYDSSGKKIIRRKAWKPDPQKASVRMRRTYTLPQFPLSRVSFRAISWTTTKALRNMHSMSLPSNYETA